MALDHYVSQVHLRKFYAEAANFRKMHAYRKSDGFAFICGSKDVCRIDDGSTNQFLTEPRILEDFLKCIEPYYDGACDALANDKFDIDDIVIIAGFVAFVIGTSPTAMRLGAESLTKMAHTEIELMDRMGILELAPEALGRRSATELLREGKLYLDTDAKFPQAMGISGIVNLAKSFSTFHWEILVNRQSSRFPFLTSDFPAAIEGLGRHVPANRIVPLRPDLAVRIIPQVRPRDWIETERDFLYQHRSLSPSEVRKINLCTIRSAENLVFSSLDSRGINRMITQNARFRLELEHARIPKGDGYMLLNSVVVKEPDPN